MESQLTNPEYWDQIWNGSDLPSAINGEADPVTSELCEFLRNALAGRSGLLLEIGCGCSRWLPYFSSLGFRVAGIDYSPTGCQQAKMILDREGLVGDIFEGDAFDANPRLLGRFDVVVSLGVVEHFQDTAETIRTFSRYLKPRGLMISTCPNMVGLLGLSQKVLNRPVYDRHIPLSAEDLHKAHRAAGLNVARCSYVGSLDFHMINLHGGESFSKTLAHHMLMRLSRVGWKLPLRVKRNQLLSSHVACAAYAD